MKIGKGFYFIARNNFYNFMTTAIIEVIMLLLEYTKGVK